MEIKFNNFTKNTAKTPFYNRKKLTKNRKPFQFVKISKNTSDSNELFSIHKKNKTGRYCSVNSTAKIISHLQISLNY